MCDSRFSLYVTIYKKNMNNQYLYLCVMLPIQFDDILERTNLHDKILIGLVCHKQPQIQHSLPKCVPNHKKIIYVKMLNSIYSTCSVTCPLNFWPLSLLRKVLYTSFNNFTVSFRCSSYSGKLVIMRAVAIPGIHNAGV